jgi:hypothetical protein
MYNSAPNPIQAFRGTHGSCSSRSVLSRSTATPTPPAAHAKGRLTASGDATLIPAAFTGPAISLLALFD